MKSFMRVALAVGLAVPALSQAAFAAMPGAPSLRDRQQAACYDDVQRLCGDAVPDVDKVTACMKSKRSQVSAKCAKFYKH